MILEILLSEKDKNGRHHFRFLGKNETCRQQTSSAGEGGKCADSRINMFVNLFHGAAGLLHLSGK